MKIAIIRDDPEPTRTFGKMLIDDKYFGETLEDAIRDEKIAGQTAIPRGKYRVSITFSQRFQRPMPYVHDVPGFSGIRVHGGNSEFDTSGCPLLGAIRTPDGIRNCGPINARLMGLLEEAEDAGEPVTLEVV